jgi:Fur family peroxide stress response transcriptional regulator
MKKNSAIPACDSTTGAYASAMVQGGLRLTPQRRQVYEVLMSKRDHPTATEVFIRAQQQMPSISLATVYNCLETMVGNGLVKAVHVDREPTRFCANLREHGHFHCTDCGHITDIEFSESQEHQGWKLPSGFLVTQHDVSLRGLCSECGTHSSTTQTKLSQHSKTRSLNNSSVKSLTK